jgi:hypothetical protein
MANTYNLQTLENSGSQHVIPLILVLFAIQITDFWVIDAKQSLGQQCIRLALTPCSRAIEAMDAPVCPQAMTTRVLNSARRRHQNRNRVSGIGKQRILAARSRRKKRRPLPTLPPGGRRRRVGRKRRSRLPPVHLPGAKRRWIPYGRRWRGGGNDRRMALRLSALRPLTRGGGG